MAGTGYTLYDFERRGPMLLLAGCSCSWCSCSRAGAGRSRWSGLAISLALVLVFVVPAILDGKPPLLVAVVGSLAMAFITIPLAHGWGPKSLAALLGTAASLISRRCSRVLFTNLTHLTGLSSEEAIFLQIGNADVSLQGLLLAGIVIGALGRARRRDDQPGVDRARAPAREPRAAGSRRLFGLALDVGRDHVSATVNTLVLAYVGAALPILLLFSAAGLGRGRGR